MGFKVSQVILVLFCFSLYYHHLCCTFCLFIVFRGFVFPLFSVCLFFLICHLLQCSCLFVFVLMFVHFGLILFAMFMSSSFVFFRRISFVSTKAKSCHIAALFVCCLLICVKGSRDSYRPENDMLHLTHHM